MTTFKDKVINRKNKKTFNVESLHKKQIEQFEKDYNTLPLLEKRYNEIKDLKQYKQQSDKLLEKISNLKNRKYEKEYYLNTSLILYNYHKGKKIEKNANTCGNDLFMDNMINKKETTSRGDLLGKFVNMIDNTNKDYEEKIQHNKNTSICNECLIEKMIYQSDSLIVCPECGDSEYIILNNDKPNYKEISTDVNCFAYKKKNHFKEILNQIQGKESTTIPDEVYEKILQEIKKTRMKTEDIKKQKIREILRKIGHTKYYEHRSNIMYKIRGIPPITLSREIEDKLLLMFDDLLKPYAKCCPKTRRNFLNYYYVIRKLCEILGLKEILNTEHLPQLKSRKKLAEHDQIWKEMIKILQEKDDIWIYIPSL
jgi:hypothetical protein